jgi:hypothetical protein
MTKPLIMLERIKVDPPCCGLTQVRFDQIAVTLDRELRRGRQDLRRLKARSASFIERRDDAKAAKIFKHRFSQATRRDREPDRMMRRRRAVGLLAEAQLGSWFHRSPPFGQPSVRSRA